MIEPCEREDDSNILLQKAGRCGYIWAVVQSYIIKARFDTTRHLLPKIVGTVISKV